MQKEMLIITRHQIITSNFACNKCGKSIKAFFVDQACLEFVGCDCNSTAVRVSTPSIMKLADEKVNAEAVLKQ